jgi:hypothetical protein
VLEVSQHMRSQIRAVPPRLDVLISVLMVGTVLRRARRCGVHMNRTHSLSKTGVNALMAHPTGSDESQSSGLYGSAGRFEDESR